MVVNERIVTYAPGPSGTMENGPVVRTSKYVRIAGADVEIPPQSPRRQAERARQVDTWNAVLLRGRQSEDEDSEGGTGVIRITLTTIYFSTLPRPTLPATSSTRTESTIAAIRTSSAIESSTSLAATSSIVPQTTSAGNGLKPASRPGFPTALVASLCTLIPVSILIAFFFYLYYRRRHPTPVPSVASEDKYVWGPLGLIRRRDKDKDNPVLRAEEQAARVDPIAEAIREEERDRLGRLRRSGEARFYAPGVRHLVEYVGSKERMKVIIDWRDKVKMERLW